MFETLSPAPPDAILGLTDAYKSDPRPGKINLGVGVFMDAAGKTPVLESVRRAELRLLETETTKSYLPISGSPAYANGVQDLLFGPGHALLQENRVRTAHTPGGTGGLRVGADFLSKFRSGATIWVSNPTWANHKAIFAAAGFQVKEYPYYDATHKGLNVEAMLETLAAVPASDIVLLHVCCHNPTGVDPSPEQWRRLAACAAGKGWLPFFDFAYQGFGSSVEADRAPLFLFAEQGLECVISSSCSKNFGLYNERTGGFSLVAKSDAAAEAAFSHVKTAIRSNYSNPPRHGGAVVETILADAELHKEWLGELAAMRTRIHQLRHEFVAGLTARGVAGDFSFITRQQGMFSFSGLNDSQVKRLREEFGIYMVGGGRMNIAGIHSGAMAPLCHAMAVVLNEQ